ncbi:MAG: polyprenyl synthetase [Bacteroidetes bacterium GWF2_33_38]|nr:MAG: polyprenyl synthetase [Bacteroidetes bacterium GWF2_33_38]OFY90145.1 MAG: polyprenyl synthetase [Bacteroidetes bacterium RIFOXYA2_FULL_33_7]
MSSMLNIQSPIKDEIRNFEPYFRNTIKSKVPLLEIITNYILRRKGKQMRPMFVFLSAKINGQVSDASYVAASFIELLHTATLIHDDVVDESYQRRGFFSLNAIWKNKISVLVGDYFLSRGLLLAVETKQFDLLKIVSEAVQEMSEGELLQIEKARKLDITEEVYYEIIRKKTASLIASCTACGAKSVGASDEAVAKMKQIGEDIGMAFQIKDDLFDYEKTNLTGKPSGNDLKEKKLTLPLIHALKNCSSKERREIVKIVKTKKKTTKQIQKVVDFVHKYKGIEYSIEVMIKYKNSALNLLETFNENEAKNSLKSLIEYSISRQK